MNSLALVFFLACAFGILTVSRRAAPIPILLGCCYITLGQGIQILGMSFPVYRMLLAVGLLRVFLKGETISGRLNPVDKLVGVLACWTMFASFFHFNIPGAGPQFTSGILFNITASYFLTRCFCQNSKDAVRLAQVVALIMIPVAGEMLMEKMAGRNLFAIFGGVPEIVGEREGKLRAQGPFLHPILAGTVGATCLPLLIGIRRSNAVIAHLGIIACVIIVFTSASSGPVVSLMAGLFATALWHYRQHVAKLRWVALILYILLDLTMRQPAYYLLGRIDLSGGSTGWHRAYLIDQSIQHLSEWWLFGTDFTRHWILHGVSPDGRNSDITNYYLVLGILGGVATLFLFVAILWHSFRQVGRAVHEQAPGSAEAKFMIWCFGASLFAHAATSISVSYFDQSVFFVWMTIGIASSSVGIAGSGALDEASSDLSGDVDDSTGEDWSKGTDLPRPGSGVHALAYLAQRAVRPRDNEPFC